ncbi:GerAB/ArcD/ProY family transporter [Gorillibacterium sp. sgz500922]|uniref:GerAB/ArcD/ProY family transporter n=1 Tax=Gorillibacterium sp. sgz500922 TaxID=3446694 RepID=UPI003F6620B7
MKTLDYADAMVDSRTVAFMVCKIAMGIGILILPDAVTSVTHTSDGWIPILAGGAIACLFTVLIALLTRRFPQMDYHDMVSRIAHPVVAHIVVFLFSLYLFLFTCYEIRGLSSIAKLYLFDNTPIEAISLAFLLVLVYGVSGPSVTLLRINTLFLPAILVVLALVIAFALKDFDIQALKPVFVTPPVILAKSLKETLFSYLGVEVLLFYNLYIKNPDKTAKAAVAGMAGACFVYLAVFVMSIGVFSETVVENTLYPLAELAKQVEIPGGLMERFEAPFFLAWVLSLFCTAAMSFDVTLLGIQSIFPKAKRMPLIYLLSPLLLLGAMMPRNLIETRRISTLVSYMGMAFGWMLPALFLFVAVVRGIRGAPPAIAEDSKKG